MKILVVNGFNSSYNGIKRFQELVSTIKEVKIYF